MPIPVQAQTPTDPYVGDWTGSLAGLQIGAGTPYKLVGVAGWFEMLATPLGGLASLTPKAFVNASYPLPYYAPERVVTILLDIETTPGQMPAVVGALTQATQPGVVDVPLSFQVGGVSTMAYGSVSHRDVPTGLEWLTGYAQATVELTCEDARRFGADLSATTGLPSSTGGLSWPLSWPAVWSATQVTGQCAMTSPGNASGPMVLRVDGPVTAPVITHVSSGRSLVLGSNLTVYAGDFLLVDTEARTVLYNGQSSRNGYVTSRGWFALDPGVNTLAFNADTYSTSALLTVTGTPAWI